MSLVVVLDALAAVVVIALLGLAMLALRRRFITRRGGTFDCSLRDGRAQQHGKGWVLGVGRYAGDALEWYRVFSYSPRPRRVLDRQRLRVVDRREPSGIEAFSLLAGRERLTINAGSAARVASSATASYCQQFTRELDEGHVDPATMYVLRADIADRFRSAAITPVICPRIDQYVVCVAAATYAQ